MRATAMFLPGSHIVVCGYGWVGKGVAAKARGMGAIVTVTEVDPIKALEAKMDGFDVTTLADAAPHGDLFITCTGQTGVIRREHIERMKDGAILANTGHFDVEIDVSYLYSLHSAKKGRNKKEDEEDDDGPKEVRPGVERFDVAGKKIYLLSKGRVVNLVAAEGHSPEVMALSFANQLLSILYISKNYQDMERKVYDVPEEIDIQVANSALEAMGIKIDKVTKEQRNYHQDYHQDFG
jgi:adenosylhomocysteinase